MVINREISKIFLTDARDYLFRYKILKENATHLGLRGKLLIELLFAQECTLKALVFAESMESEKTTYKKIITHKIDKLLKLLSENSKREYHKLITTDFSNFKVDIRYQLECEIEFRSINGTLANKYYDTVANFVWLDNIYIQIQNLISYVKSMVSSKIETKNFSDFNVDGEIAKHSVIINLKN